MNTSYWDGWQQKWDLKGKSCYVSGFDSLFGALLGDLDYFLQSILFIYLFLYWLKLNIESSSFNIASIFTSQAKTMAPQTSTAVLPHALHIPGINKLAGKRVVLASSSPRRKDILQIFVRLMGL